MRKTARTTRALLDKCGPYQSAVSHVGIDNPAAQFCERSRSVIQKGTIVKSILVGGGSVAATALRSATGSRSDMARNTAIV